MGQPAVELPDPLQTPSGTDAAGADDLLAQLAGDEIDRLLAEADVGHDATPLDPAAPAPAAADDASPVDENIAAAEDVLAQELTEAQAPANPTADSQSAQALRPAATPVSDSGAADVDVLADASLSPADAATVDDLLAERSEEVLKPHFDAHLADMADEPAPTSSPVVDAPPREATAVVSKAEAAPAPAAPSAAPVSAADEIARELDEAVGSSRIAAAEAASPAASDAPDATPVSLPTVLDEALASAQAEEDSLPFYLRPLQWLNAPFAGLSEETRLALGKIAIITFFNALAVLVYVMFFRH